MIDQISLSFFTGITLYYRNTYIKLSAVLESVCVAKCKEPENLVNFYLCLDYLKRNKVSQLF